MNELKPYETITVELDPPKENEVQPLVKIGLNQ